MTGSLFSTLCIALVLLLPVSTHAARDYISVVGSSTVFPFSAVVAERFGKESGFPTPKIEATGSGGGFKLFCSGIGLRTPDITNASRRIRPSEFDLCRDNGVEEIGEVLVGYDGIVLARSNVEKALPFSRRDLYLALAKSVPDPSGEQRLVRNPYQRWSELNPSLPDQPIVVYGPSPTSGTRDTFVEMVMNNGCRQSELLSALEREDPEDFLLSCQQIREDGRYISTGENDSLTVQKLIIRPEAIGILGYSVTEQYRDLLVTSEIDGVPANYQSITSGFYPISRPLYVYIKLAHTRSIPGLRGFVSEMVSQRASGPFGYLVEKGMIPVADSRSISERLKVDRLLPSSLQTNAVEASSLQSEPSKVSDSN